MENTGKYQQEQGHFEKSSKSGLQKIGEILRLVGTWIYRFRKLFLAIPVIWASIYLARINWGLLPESVGFHLMSNGNYARMISRELAVYGPMAVTGVCLILMVCSKRTLYPWLISAFTLVLPLLILITNIFPS